MIYFKRSPYSNHHIEIFLSLRKCFLVWRCNFIINCAYDNVKCFLQYNSCIKRYYILEKNFLVTISLSPTYPVIDHSKCKIFSAVILSYPSSKVSSPF